MSQPTHSKKDFDSVRIFGHNRIIYWWPVWLCGYALAAIGYFYVDPDFLARIKHDGANWYTLCCLLYIFLMLFVFFFTNVRTGAMEALLIVFVGIALLFALYYTFGQINIFRHMPDFLVFMNSNFFLVYSTGLLVIWLVVSFVIDPRHSSVVSGGKLRHTKVLMETGVTLEEVEVTMSRSDIPCHYILGLWMFGDMEIGKGDKKRTIYNVAFVRSKVKKAQDIIAAGQVAPSK